MASSKAISRKRLAGDMKAVISDAEELLKATAGQAGETIQSVRDKIEKTFNSAKTSMEKLEKAGVDKVKGAAKATDHYVHDNPWLSIGVAAGLGLIVGWLVHRK